jgi:uncharacterized membrane protein
MPASRPGWTDEQVEQMVGRLLQIGVLVAALVVLVGGIVYLIHDGLASADHHHFHGEPKALRSFWGIGTEATDLRSRGLMQLGLLLLILTPVSRVALTVFAFIRQRDYTFIAVTLIVLGLLVYSLLSGYLG